ncbi:MAG: tyrosine-type recombinase/integrase [Myxococcota bacterium]
MKQVQAWVRNPARSPKKLFDGHGLFLQVSASGTATWRMKYAGGNKLITFGPFPEVSIVEARAKRDAARALIRDNRDPVVARRVARAEASNAAGDTFAELAELWLERKRSGWSAAHYSTVSETLGRHILPHVGTLPISEIRQPMVAAVVQRLNDRIDTAQKVRQICAGVFRLAQALGKYQGDNPADAAREVIARRKLKGRRPALETWPELGDVLRRARQAHLSPAVHTAHRLCAFTAARMGNVIAAEWSEFRLDLETPEWVIPRAKMKAQDRHFDHVVILGPTITAELRAWHALNGAPSRGWLFPSVAGDGRHITHESIEKVYRVTLGLKDRHTPHGWRAAFSTLARDEGFSRDAVELALDHVHDNDVARAYDRGSRRTERVKLAAWWNERLSEAERGRP